ncbi:unnamed protein product [Discosporangium mesarthrocarpum]
MGETNGMGAGARLVNTGAMPPGGYPVTTATPNSSMVINTAPLCNNLGTTWHNEGHQTLVTPPPTALPLVGPGAIPSVAVNPALPPALVPPTFTAPPHAAWGDPAMLLIPPNPSLPVPAQEAVVPAETVTAAPGVGVPEVSIPAGAITTTPFPATGLVPQGVAFTPQVVPAGRVSPVPGVGVPTVSIPTSVMPTMPFSVTGPVPQGFPPQVLQSGGGHLMAGGACQGVMVNGGGGSSYLQVNPAYPGLREVLDSPPLFMVDGFLSHEECDALMALANDYMVVSPVVGQGAGEVSTSRTSSSCFLAREDLPSVCSKVIALTGKPVEHLELPQQVGRYYTGQKYDKHWDAFDLSTEDGVRFAQNGGQRVCTVLIYLNDVGPMGGGCTFFPELGLRIRPRKGMAVVFFPATLDGRLDPVALHTAEPAVETKWVSQIWIRQGPYQGTPSVRLTAARV